MHQFQPAQPGIPAANAFGNCYQVTPVTDTTVAKRSATAFGPASQIAVNGGPLQSALIASKNDEFYMIHLRIGYRDIFMEPQCAMR